MMTAAQSARVHGFEYIHTRKCKQCGKKFSIVSSAYAYKLEEKGKTAWFCSYGCMRKVQKPIEAARRAKFQERVNNDVLYLEELEKRNQMMLAAYYAKKERKTAMAEKEKRERENEHDGK